ncbi:hypothetical protein COK39_09575 [Priestia megaterium]|nr:hypothetical protein COK39_09575 [Priestia megaterium]
MYPIYMNIILNFIAFMLLSAKLSYCVYTMTDSKKSMYFLNVPLLYYIRWEEMLWFFILLMLLTNQVQYNP